jgi:excisionase family DNA binding protein
MKANTTRTKTTNETPASQGDRDLLAHVQKVIDGHEGPLMIGREGASVEVPEPLFHILTKAVRLLASGQSISILSANEEFTTQAAANYLGMSRPHLVKLLEEKKIPFHFVGTHRRVYLRDLQTFEALRGEQRREALDKLNEQVIAASLYDSDYKGDE